MIIKVTSRKDTNFRQIVEYIHKEDIDADQVFTYIHNINTDPDDLEGMIAAFHENEQYRKKRKNGVAFYHDVLSFSPKDAGAIRENLDMLRDLTEQYIRLRCPNAIAIARPHIEEDHVHIHIILSATEQEQAKSVRVSKAELAAIKQQIRAYQQAHYPELVHSYQSEYPQQAQGTYTHATWQMDKRGAIQEHKEKLKSILVREIQRADSWNDLIHRLSIEDISIYKRGGKISGIKWKHKKYRFSTLIRDESVQLYQTRVHDIFNQNQKEVYKKSLDPMGLLAECKLPMKWQAIQADIEAMEEDRIRTEQMWQEQQDLDIIDE